LTADGTAKEENGGVTQPCGLFPVRCDETSLYGEKFQFIPIIEVLNDAISS